MWSQNGIHENEPEPIQKARELSSLLLVVLQQAFTEITLSKTDKDILKAAVESATNLSRYLDQAISGERTSQWYVGEALQLKGQLSRLTTRIEMTEATLPRYDDHELVISSESRDLAVIRRDLRSIGIEDTEHGRYFIKIAQQVLDEIESITRFATTQYSKSRIIRKIRPKLEHKQVVLSVLNYFGRIIEQKHSEMHVKVTTEQTQDEILFIVEMNRGDKGAIEEELYEYGLVVMEEQSPERLLPVSSQAMELKHKLELAKMELRHTTELLHAERSGYGNKIQSLESEVSWLRKTVGEGLSHNQQLQALITDLAKESSKSVQAALLIVLRKASDGLDDTDEDRVSEELKKILSEEPGVLDKLQELAAEVFSGTTANLLSSWIAAIAAAIPK